jgi:hypothetical protein
LSCTISPLFCRRCVLWQDNIKFLRTVASLDEAFHRMYNASYPVPPLTLLVQNFDLDLSSLTPPTAEGYLDSVLGEKGIQAVQGKDNAQVQWR